MYDELECPYCGKNNDMSDALCDGLSDDNKFDKECEHCGEEFEVYVEFDPTYSASKIVYEDCDKCYKSVRDINKKGRTFPFPTLGNRQKLCHECYCKLMFREMD
jgi:hypothetical protein